MAKQTALYAKHIELGGRMVDFAGFELPIQYSKGIIFEHNTVRKAVGLFDVSHMGELILSGENATNALRYLVTNNVANMSIGQCRYALACYPDGGIVDDLLIYRMAESKYMLVVNASNTEKDFDWFRKNLKHGATIENISDTLSQIALQGPLAYNVMEKLVDVAYLPDKYYWFTEDMSVAGFDCLVSTTGYTGELGYELYVEPCNAVKLYEALLDAGKEFGIEPIGLGARDTLRFECCMPLYGHELSDKTIANEVGLDFAIKLHGDDFIGKAAIVNNVPKYERRGLRLVGRGVPREHFEVLDENGEVIGMTTSGGMCPCVGGAYAMARVKVGCSAAPYVDIRGKRVEAEWTTMPFYKRS